MASEKEEKISEGLHWIIAEGANEEIPLSLLTDLKEFLQNTPPTGLIKDSRVRAAFIIPGPNRDLFLKHYKIKDLLEGWKYLVQPSKARREWQMARRALARGIPTPSPLAMAERRRGFFLRDAFLITQAISPSIPLIELIARGGNRELLFEAARLLRQAHKAGLFHEDLHTGNILVGTNDKKLYLIDLHRATFVRRISRRQGIRNLAQFFYSLQAWLSPEEKKSFLQCYDEAGDTFKGGLDQVLIAIEEQQGRLQRRHMKSRTKRCLKESSGFSVARQNGWRIWGRRGWKPQQLLKIVTEHRAIVAKRKQGLIKDDRRTAITLFSYKDTRLCVKEYRYQRPWQPWKELFRGSKSRRAWLMGNGLVARGIGAICPQALLERRSGGLLQEAFFIMETPPGYIELDRYMVKTFTGHRLDDDRREAFVDAFAGFMASLYFQGIIHRDFKTCNIMVQEMANSWHFGLVDMDDVRLDKKIGRGRLVKGLVQLHTSTPLFMERRERMRFLSCYLQSIGEADRGEIIKEVIKGSKGRKLVYVAPDGAVVRDVDWEGLCGPLPEEEA